MTFFSSLFRTQTAKTNAPIPIVDPIIEIPSKLKLLNGAPPRVVAERAEQEPVDYSGTNAEGYLRLLIEQDKAAEVLGFLAFGLPEHAAVKWATECYVLQGKQRSAPDHAAYVSAQAWLAQPSSEQQLAAARAALDSGHNGPGGWAAQGAAWAKPSTGSTSAITPDPLVGKAVLGSVMLSAAMTRPDISLPEAPKLADHLKELEVGSKAKSPADIAQQLGKKAVSSTARESPEAVPMFTDLQAQSLGAGKLPAGVVGLSPQISDPKIATLQKVAGLMTAPGIVKPSTGVGAVPPVGAKISAPGIVAQPQLLAAGKLDSPTVPQMAAGASAAPSVSIAVPTAEERRRQLEMYRPFIEKGLAIAAGG